MTSLIISKYIIDILLAEKFLLILLLWYEILDDFRCCKKEKMTQNGHMSKILFPELLCVYLVSLYHNCVTIKTPLSLLSYITCTLFDTVNKGTYYTIVNHLVDFVFVWGSTCVVVYLTLYFNHLSHLYILS